MQKNLLKKSKVYLIGSMQYGCGRNWRETVKSELSPLDITCFDPYDNPFIIDIEETEIEHEKIQRALDEEKFDEVSSFMKTVRSHDLALTDRADFIICYLDPGVFTVGTFEELFNSVRMKKPIFLIINGGKKKAPYWLFGALPHRYFYENVEDVIKIIKKIDSGEIEIDSDRWRLLKPEYR